MVAPAKSLDGRRPMLLTATPRGSGADVHRRRNNPTKMQAMAFLFLHVFVLQSALGFRPWLGPACRCDGRRPLLDGLQSPEGVGANEAKPKRQRIPVLVYKDEYVIVSKPPGMAMHHNSESRWGWSKSPVLQAAVKRQMGRKPYLVHRLDHRTSGACIVGFSSEAAGSLHGRLRSEDACKLYVALVRGDLRERFRRAAETGFEEEFAVGAEGSRPRVGSSCDDRPDAHSPPVESEHRGKITVNRPIKDKQGVDKDATTDFFFLSSLDMHEEDDENDGGAPSSPYTNKSLSLLLCRPRTGRTHQIRRHLQKTLNCPIIGDSEHGDSRVNRHWRQTIGLDRLALHCFYLDLPSVRRDDDGDDEIQCIAPLTDDFRGALLDGKLGKLWEEATRVEPKLMKEFVDERGGSFGRHFRKRKNEQISRLQS